MKEAIALIEKCLETQKPVLNLGNCGLSDISLFPSNEVGKMVAKCTHITKLILSNRYDEWGDWAAPSIELNTGFIYNDVDDLCLEKKGARNIQNKHYFKLPKPRNYKLKGSITQYLNRLDRIPDVVTNLVNLQELVCCGDEFGSWGIDSIAPLRGLSKLRYLGLGNNKFDKVGDLRWFPCLEKLDLRNNYVDHLLKIEGHRNLRSIDLSKNRLTHIIDINRFPKLRWLNLSGNALLSMEGLKPLMLLQFLDLSNNALTTFTPFERNTLLKSLNISNNLLNKLEYLGDLPNLQFLFARCNRIYCIPGIKNFKKLEILDLSFNMISKLPGSISSLEGLQAIDISNNNIHLLNDISSLKSLRLLNAASNVIDQVENYHISDSLEEINFNDNNLSELNVLPYYPNLKRLYAGVNQIERVIEGNNPFLEKLVLSDNNISDAISITGCKNLQYLDISNNNLSGIDIVKFIPDFKDGLNQEYKDLEENELLPKLKVIDASGNRFSEIPNILFLSGLTKLILTNNKILSVDNINMPLGLQEFYLDGNLISTVNNISSLLNYKVLDLSNNPITKMKGLLRILNDKPEIKLRSRDGVVLQITCRENSLLVNSPYFRIPARLDDNDNENLKNWFIAREQGICINMEVRCVLLGNGETGKTALSHRLRTGEFYPENNRTHGILIERWKLEAGRWSSEFSNSLMQIITESNVSIKHVDVDNRIILNIWDFGGQEFYHATHRLFMSNDILYLVLWEQETDYQDEERGIFPQEYWLSNIQHYAPDSSVLLVQNRAEKDFYVEKDSRYKISTYNENNKESIVQYNLDIKVLKEAMLRKMCSLSGLGMNIPRVYEKVKIRIRQLGQPYISFLDYVMICQNEDDTELQIMDNVSQCESLLRYLDIIGCVVSFRNRGGIYESIIRDYVFTDPRWLTRIIYEILEKGHDEFDLSHVASVVAPYHLKEIVWINIMQDFGLIFEVKNKQGIRYVVPQYLPKECRNQQALEMGLGEKDMPHSFTVRYPKFMPNSNFLRLISYYGSEHVNNVYWKNGLLFFHNGQTVYARCINNVKERKIRISVQNNDNDTVADVLNCIYDIDPSEDLEISIDEEKYILFSTLKKKMEEDRQEVDTVCGHTLFTDDVRFLFKRKEEQVETKRPIRVFVSYSKKDQLLQELLLRELKPHLVDKPDFEFTFWTDRAIDMGAYWGVEIKKEIERADIAILLVSANYASSKYVRKEELGAFLKKMEKDKFLMLPVLMRSYDFESFKALSGLQFFQAKFRDYGFDAPAFRNKFMPFDVLGDDKNTTDQQLNSYCKNLADKIYEAVANKFSIQL